MNWFWKTFLCCLGGVGFGLTTFVVCESIAAESAPSAPRQLVDVAGLVDRMSRLDVDTMDVYAVHALGVEFLGWDRSLEADRTAEELLELLRQYIEIAGLPPHAYELRALSHICTY